MNTRFAVLAGAVALALGLAGCATDEHYYGPPAPYADVDYDAYYDGSYGPFYGGYWGPGDQFYYWSQDHRHYHRDKCPARTNAKTDDARSRRGSVRTAPILVRKNDPLGWQ